MCNNPSMIDPYQQLDDYIEGLPYKKENVILVLHRAQELFGYLPYKVQLHIAKKLDIPTAKIYGVVSFYSYFTMKPRGQHVANVCTGTACFVRGAETLQGQLESELGIKTGQITSDNLFSLESVRCIGACGLAPVITVDGKVHGRLHNSEDVKKVIDKYRPEAMPEARGVSTIS